MGREKLLQRWPELALAPSQGGISPFLVTWSVGRSSWKCPGMNGGCRKFLTASTAALGNHTWAFLVHVRTEIFSSSFFVLHGILEEFFRYWFRWAEL